MSSAAFDFAASNSEVSPAALPDSLRGRILVAGAGVSGRGCASVLLRLGADVVVADGNADSRARLEADLSVTTIDAATANPADYSLVVTSPGWAPSSPLLLAAAAAGVEVIGDVELAYRLDAASVFGAPRTWLAVTGTNGKTTTTGMLAAIMAADEQRSGKRSQAVGNIGTSPFDALAASPRVDVLVAELSSFQLHWSSQLRAEVGVLLNLADDHLDWHGSFGAYAEAKAKVLAGAHAVIGRDDSQVREYADAAAERGALSPDTHAFTHTIPNDGEVGVIDGQLVINNVAGVSATVIDDVTALQPSGMAGILDAAAAACAALLAGAEPASITEGLESYTVAGHRGELVHRHNGIAFIDNSKATNPHAAEAAMRGLDNVVWVAGGQLKGADVSDLLDAHAERLKAAVVMGVDKQVLYDALQQRGVATTVIESTDPLKAMEEAVTVAVQHAEPGDTVLLAPAGASLDMYQGMAQRGDFFAAAAQRIAR